MFLSSTSSICYQRLGKGVEGAGNRRSSASDSPVANELWHNRQTSVAVMSKSFHFCIKSAFQSQRAWALSPGQTKSGLQERRVKYSRCNLISNFLKKSKDICKQPTFLSRKRTCHKSYICPRQGIGLGCQASLRGVSRSGKEEKDLLDGDARIAEMLEAGNKAAVEGIGFKGDTGSRLVLLTLHGVVEREEVARLEEQLLDVEGIESLWTGPVTTGGLRGGSFLVKLEVDSRLSVAQLLKWIHAVDHRILALPYENQRWTWRGHNMNYAVAGQGSPVVLVHGFDPAFAENQTVTLIHDNNLHAGGSSGHFRNLIAQLADHHKVYSLDLLGFGDSDKPPEPDYSPNLWSDSVVDFVNEVVGGPAVLVGNSIGSLTALNAAAKGGEEVVSGLVLMNVSGSMNRKGLAQDDWLLALLTPVFYVLETLLKKPSVARYLFNGFRSKENVKKILEQQVYRDKAAVDDKLVDILYEPSTAPGAVDVFVKVFTGEAGPRPEELVKAISPSVPMLVLWGDRDPWTPVNGKLAMHFQRLAGERSNVDFFPLRDVGHCPHDDRVELAAVHFLPWLSTVEQ